MTAQSWPMEAWRNWLLTHIFRIITAAIVLVGYGYGLIYFPQALTWWKRTVTTLVERGCGLLPYPWGDRFEATVGDFGLWVQLTVAILAFRVIASVVINGIRHLFQA